MTLTFELIREMVKIHSSTKLWVHTPTCSGMRGLTGTHTHRQSVTDLIPLTVAVGGKNKKNPECSRDW